MSPRKAAPPPVKKAGRRPPVEEIEEEEDDAFPDELLDTEEEEAPVSKKGKATGPGARKFDFKDQMTAADWQAILDQTSAAGGPFYFLKDGKTRLRLVPQKGTKNQFFTEAVNVFNGRTRNKVIFLAILSSGKGVTEEMKTKVTPVVAAKTVITGILSLLAEGYNLLSPTKGYGLTITRTGANLNTAYSVIASQNPVPVPEDIEWPEDLRLADLAQQYEEQSATRDATRTGGGGRRSDEEIEETEAW